LLKDVSVSPNLVKGFTEVFSVSFSSISSKKGFFGFGGMVGAPSDCRKGLAFGILVLGASSS
jgi:hypothetical protein